MSSRCNAYGNQQRHKKTIIMIVRMEYTIVSIVIAIQHKKMCNGGQNYNTAHVYWLNGTSGNLILKYTYISFISMRLC